jgi:uncharacterized membrane protein YdbT with pleckstrin-like domain
MGYVSKNLMEGEAIVYMAHVHWIIYLPGWIMLFGGIALSEIAFKRGGDQQAVFGLIAFILIFSGLISLLNAFIFKISTELAVTTKRVIVKRGLIRRDTLELNHSKVESFQVNQSVLGRVLNYGSVEVLGTGGGKTPIPNIDDPLLFRRKAMETIG